MEKWSREVKEVHEYVRLGKGKRRSCGSDLCLHGWLCIFPGSETGEATRDPLYLGFTFKGAGALDPRGYPIMYVGAGYDSNEGTARVFVVNLLDCSVMYTLEIMMNFPFAEI